MRKGIVIITLLTIFVLGAGGLTNSALANDELGHPEPAPEQIPDGPQEGADLKKTVVSLIDWLFVVLLLTAVIFIVLAAFQFLTEGGDAAKVSEARQKLLYAIIAIIVALFAKSIPTVIIRIVGT